MCNAGNTHGDISAQEAALESGILLQGVSFGLTTTGELQESNRRLYPNNANTYTPWDDPQIPYECECGEIIYSDSAHTHPGDSESEAEAEREFQAELERRAEEEGR